MDDNNEPLRITVQHPRLDAAIAPSFREEIRTVAGNMPDRVLLDLTGVEFIDSTGLGVLVALLKQTGPGGRIAVIGARAPVLRLFQMTRLDSLFRLCASEADARDALG